MTSRGVLAILLTVAIACAEGRPSGSSDASRKIEYEVSEGSWMAVDVSPDGKKVIFDLIGHLYELPIAGGPARPLTSGDAWHRAPRYSPDGSQIAMIRDGDGGDEVWVMPAGGGDFRQVTDHSKQRHAWASGTPTWAPDGKSIYYGDSEHDTAPNLPMWRIALTGGTPEPLETKPPEGARRNGAVSPDGRFLYFTERDEKIDTIVWKRSTRISVARLDLKTQERAAITDMTAGVFEFTPQISDDGRFLSYIRRDREGRSALRIREIDANGELVAGSDRELRHLPDEDDPARFDASDERPAYSFTPDGKHIVLWSSGKIHKVAVADGTDEIIPFTATVSRMAAPMAVARTSLPDGPLEVLGVQWPRLSRDGKTLVFGAVGYIWVQDMPNGTPRRLSSADSITFEYMPTLSPDGKTVAYIELRKEGFKSSPARLMTIPITGGQPQALLSDRSTYLAPTWSPDGTKIAFLRDEGHHSELAIAMRTQSGKGSVFGWVALDERVPHVVAPVQKAQRETWGRLVHWAKDGKSLRYSWEHDRWGAPDSTEMREVPLEGGQSRQMVLAGIDSRGMVPSPDGKHALILGVDDDLRLVKLSEDGSPVRTDLYDSTLKRITSTGVEMVDWQGDSTFIYSFANKLYRYTIGAGKEPELFHTVKLTVPRLEGKETVAFTNARIITVSGEKGAGDVIEKGTLVVQGRRISAVGPSDKVKVPDGARVIDATGLTLMPAIGDMHYHAQGGTNLLSKMISDNGEIGLRQSIAYGVTFGWQPGGPTRNAGGLATAELQESGRVPGPRWINAPWAVNLTTYGDNSPYVMNSYEDALRITRHRADLRGTLMKEYMTRRRDHRKWFGKAAREVGVSIASHVEGLDMALSRATDGYTGFDHPPFAVPVYEDVRQYLARTGAIWTANINVTQSVDDGGNTDAQRAFLREVVRRWPEQHDKWDYHHPGKKLDTMPPKMAFEKTRLGRTAKAVAYLMAGGAKITISAHNPPPLYNHAEMWYFQQAGGDRGEIIRAGTMNAALKAGLHRELGSLEVGKVADILVLIGNPLDDIINTVAQKYVVADGVLYDVMPKPSARAAR